jgi:RNA polymerase sigma-70 factor (ECF subfamily)
MEAYRRYGPALLRKAKRMLHNPVDAEDVVQGLFVDLLQSGGQAGPGAAQLELGYLYRAVTHRCLNVLRDAQNRRRLLDQREAPATLARTTCEERAIDLDLLLKLSAQLDQLSCEMLVYRFIDDMTQEEIAELTGYSRKTVGKRLDDARSAVLRLAGHAPGGEA